MQTTKNINIFFILGYFEAILVTKFFQSFFIRHQLYSILWEVQLMYKQHSYPFYATKNLKIYLGFFEIQTILF